MHYELKNTSQADASVPRGTARYLCTYHFTSVRTVKRNQSEPIGTIPLSFSFTNLQFKWKSDLTIPEIFDSNVKPFQHVPNHFHSRSHARTKQFSVPMKIRAQSNYQTIFDSNKNQSIGCYVVITYITQICVLRNQRASRNQRARNT